MSEIIIRFDNWWSSMTPRIYARWTFGKVAMERVDKEMDRRILRVIGHQDQDQGHGPRPQLEPTTGPSQCKRDHGYYPKWMPNSDRFGRRVVGKVEVKWVERKRVVSIWGLLVGMQLSPSHSSKRARFAGGTKRANNGPGDTSLFSSWTG